LVARTLALHNDLRDPSEPEVAGLALCPSLPLRSGAINPRDRPAVPISLIGLPAQASNVGSLAAPGGDLRPFAPWDAGPKIRPPAGPSSIGSEFELDGVWLQISTWVPKSAQSDA
jgi:hypothetical protein